MSDIACPSRLHISVRTSTSPVIPRAKNGSAVSGESTKLNLQMRLVLEVELRCKFLMRSSGVFPLEALRVIRLERIP